MRVTFLHSDEKYLYVQPSGAAPEETPLRVRYNVPQVNEEFSETCKLLWAHARLNLLDVSVGPEGVLTPAFIILEPDYLVDISTLAECFKEYGHHPANYIMARLQPSENTRPLLLGNIANLFLDEWIHSSTPPDYRATMQKAFRQYPIELAACEELRDCEKESQFFADCRLHFEHIHHTVMETFADSGYELDKEDAVLEPSYICEALGLQGRLDYMQRDMRSFIEMKSGKADEYCRPGYVTPRENNRVQMLLYQAVLQYSMGRNHRHVRPYLFYTRYPLLYPARSSWAQVRRVMDVRNRIVADEYAIQLHNSPHYTANKLKEITPAFLNERHQRNTLWQKYQAPAIEEFGTRLRALSPLEEAYFCTLYNFITKEQYIAKSGDVNYEGRTGAALLWLATLEEKLEAGEILLDLTIVENKAAEQHKPYLVLKRNTQSAIEDKTDATSPIHALPNFRTGDAVVLYERNTPADNATNKLVFKGSVERMDESEVCIRLRASQRNTAVLPAHSRYAIEHDSTMESTYRSMYQGLSAFLTATPRRRALLLGQRPPESDPLYTARITTDMDDFERITLKAQAARDYFLMIGPPGTGKTSRALRRMVEAFHADRKQVLLLSYTNRAVDEICKALATIRPAVDFIRIGSELACEESYRPYLLENVLASCTNRRKVQERIARCRLFVGTVATLSARTDLFRLKTFDVAIVDEATQILEPQLLGLLCRRSVTGADAIGRFILIGDHKQLPAVVLQSEADSEVHDEGLRSIGLTNLKDSLFERLYRNLMREESNPFRHPAAALLHPAYDLLLGQGRMHPAVADFPNRAFYGSRLYPVGLSHQQECLQPVAPSQDDALASVLNARVAFLPSVVEEKFSSCKVNTSEACLAARLAAVIYHQYAATEGFDAARTLGIITPYRSQIALIRRELVASGIDALRHILVDTVERFQGSERDVIIYAFCVNHPDQLQTLVCLTEEDGVPVDRKLNVALTRARRQLFLIGVPHLLRLNPIYRNLLDEIETYIPQS